MKLQASFPELVQSWWMAVVWLGTAVSESRAASATFNFHPSWSRQGCDYWRKNVHETEVTFEFTDRINKTFWTFDTLCARHGQDRAPSRLWGFTWGCKTTGWQENWSFLKLQPSVYLLASLNLKTPTPENPIYTQSNLLSHTLKINKWLNWNTNYCKVLLIQLFFSPKITLQNLVINFLNILFQKSNFLAAKKSEWGPEPWQNTSGACFREEDLHRHFCRI